jgi:hypothetical protein
MSIEDPVEKTTTTVHESNLIGSNKEGIWKDSETQPDTLDQEGSALSAEPLLAEINVSKKKLCGVCNKIESKYKCTRCFLP